MRSGVRAALLAGGLAGLAACWPTPAAAQTRTHHDSSPAAPARPHDFATQARDSTLRSAERAARAWLSLLDQQHYARAWDVVAPAMRSVVGYDEWAASLARLRVALPGVPRRELLKAEPSVPLFGGNSVILSFGVGPGTVREIVVLVHRAVPAGDVGALRATGAASPSWLIGGYGVLPY